MNNKKLNGLIERDYEDLKCRALQIIGSKSYLFAGETLANAACTLIHDTYKEAAKKFAQFDPEFHPVSTEFVSWYGACMQYTFLRKQRIESQQHLKLVQDYHPVACDPPTLCLSFDEMDDNLIRRETLDSILSHSQLDPFERTVVDLSYWRGWQGSEIARWFNLSPAYLRTRRQRALHYLRSIAQEIQQDEEAGELQALPRPHRTRERHDRHTRKRVAAPGQHVANAAPESPTGEQPGIQPA
jgi:DNA-directed RNA polymerase specialized sigma24 family protein